MVKNASKWNHLKVAGSILTTGQNNKEYFQKLKTRTLLWLMKLEQSIPRGLNKGSDLKFCVGFQVRQETHEEPQKTHQLKWWEYNNKDNDNSPYTLND